MPTKKEREAYVPTEGSLAARVIDHLSRHPADELTRADIADIFSVDERQVASMLAQAVYRGPLERARNHEEQEVWRPRKRAHFWPQAQRSEPPASGRRRKSVSLAVVSSIEIESDVPLFERPSVSGELIPWLDRLKIKQSFKLPVEARGVATTAQSILRQSKPGVRFAIRQISKSQIGVWRVA